MYTTDLAVICKMKICYMLQELFKLLIQIILHELSMFSNILVEKRSPVPTQDSFSPRFAVNTETFHKKLHNIYYSQISSPLKNLAAFWKRLGNNIGNGKWRIGYPG